MHDPSTDFRNDATAAALARPYCQATLAEHRALELLLRRTSYAFEDEVLRFLAVPDTEISSWASQHPLYDVPQLDRALSECFPDWVLVGEGGGDNSYHLWAPKRRQMAVAPGRSAEFLVDGTRFYRLPDGSRRVLLFEEEQRSEQTIVEFTLFAARSERANVQRELQSLRRRMARRHYLRGQAIDASGRLLRRARRLTWDHVVLEPSVRAALRANVVDFLALRKLFRQNGVPQRRGILLYGPPGNGKTLIGKVLAGLGRATFVYVTSGDVVSGCALRHVFRLARKVRPTVLFLEDLDFFASERRTANPAVLGELLAQMDGLERNDGLVVIATTNDLEAIEPALKDRPSRFDVALKIGPPSAAARRQILANYLAAAETDAALAGRAAERSEGLSGAQLREVACGAIQAAIVRGAVSPAGRAQPALEDVEAALARLTGRHKRALGFHAPCSREESAAPTLAAQGGV